MSASKYHSTRKAFIIIEKIGIILMKDGSKLSHVDALTQMGISQKTADKLLEENPRGYKKDGIFYVYQGDFLPLTKQGEAITKAYFDDLKKIFGLTEKTKMFTGWIKGEVGKEWQPMHELDIKRFIGKKTAPIKRPIKER